MTARKSSWRLIKYSAFILVPILLIYFVTIYYVDDILPIESYVSPVDPSLDLDALAIHSMHVQHSSAAEPLPENPMIDTSKLEYCAMDRVHQNSNTFTKQELDQLIKLRTMQPTKICNEHETSNRRTKWERFDVKQFPTNMVSFVNRCKLNILKSNAEFTELWTNNQVTYNHVYKCGGTTIWNALDRMQKDGLMNGHGIKYKLDKNDSFLLRDNDYYWQHLEYFYNYLNNAFFFSYIRDPVDRSLSGYYEVAIKNREMLDVILPNNKEVKGVQRYRYLINHLLNKKCDNLDTLTHERRAHKTPINLWSGDPHLHPQIIHLLNHTFQWFPYNYIGNLSDFEQSFRMILDEFSDAYRDDNSLYDEYVQRARNRDSGKYGSVLKQDVVKRSDLSDDDIKAICEIYWIDYICLPFELPKQCNITDLLVKHYGDDVSYLDCYYV